MTMDLQIDRKPMSRGVTQLMYVGDDDAVETAIGRARAAWAVAAVAAGVAVTSRKHRGLASCIAAVSAWIALKR